MCIDKKQVGLVVFGGFLGGIIVSLLFVFSNRVPPAAIYITPPLPAATAEPTTAPSSTATPAPANVYVSGEVNTPGVYQLPPGSLVRDAILQAGGFTEKADASRVNLAQRVTDGMQVNVPAEGAPSAAPVISTPETAVLPAAGSSQPASGRVNINTADLSALDTLPGIGPALAQRIVDYRQTNGPFTTIEEIMNVAGIGEATFAEIKELITTE